MNDLITALIALSKHRVGVKEAAILLLCSGGRNTPDLAEATGDDISEIRGRLQSLVRKKLVVSKDYSPSGHVNYHPTPDGLRIIEATTNQ